MNLTERRDHVIDRLSSDFAGGAFEVEELERRLALVHTAQTSAELEALVTDRPTALVPASHHVKIVFGAIERVGTWDVPPQLTARVVCGHLLLDLREARLAPGVTELDVHVTMGNVEVIVPPGVEVEVLASSFLGNIEERTERSPARPVSTVRVVGRVKLGNLELSTLHRGETKWERRWRRRASRKWRRRMGALPAPWE